MVSINLVLFLKLIHPTQSMCSTIAAASLSSPVSLVEALGCTGGLWQGLVVSVINRFQSSYFGKENFSGALKSFHQPSAGVPRPSTRSLPLKGLRAH